MANDPKVSPARKAAEAIYADYHARWPSMNKSIIPIWEKLIEAACSPVSPLDCKHPFVWPNGDCVECGVLATTMPGHTEPHHIMVPRRLAPLLERRAAPAASSQWSEQAFEVLTALNLAVKWELAPEIKKEIALLVESYAAPAVAPLVKLVQTDYGSEIAWNTGAAPAVSTPRCPKCGSGHVTLSYKQLETGPGGQGHCESCGAYAWAAQFFQRGSQPSPPRDPSRCSVCGAPRIPIEHPKTKFGLCSLDSRFDGKGECPDPTHDYYADIALAQPSPEGESK